MTTKSDLLKQKSAINFTHNFRIINLDYLMELSMGDVKFQKELTNQFIELSISETDQLNLYFETAEYHKIQPLAHSMLSTIYIMGLGPKLESHLQELKDYSQPDQLKRHINIISDVCREARVEAEIFLETL
ncbi:hypothetical protein [Pedobacter punctiformis]|uniref:HPt domain-containing protein n=1 Tax=Pedobacter punctiformis TaxID=3004097 RepID=A0ABT4LBM5_9SPHI|nr:hypothetical protein [Pedobacter sp. HCMS5-2]MCZ4245307.1 hypothetical protein [Pedobacter sp. HCMS5-2]